MAIKIEAWKDKKGKLHDSKEKAERSDLYSEVMESFIEEWGKSSSNALLLSHIIDNYDLIKKDKK